MIRKFLNRIGKWIITNNSEPIIIATHSGSFHADDVFSVAVMRMIHPEAKIIRTRNLEELSKANYRIDVGEKYNPDTEDFDHHQRGFDKVHDDSFIKKSSIGLVWDEHGYYLCGNDQEVADRVAWNLVQVIDAGDNGIKIHEPLIHGVQPYNVSRIISCFNPVWDKPSDSKMHFVKAVDMATHILVNEIESSKSAIKAKSGVMDAIVNAQDRESKIVILEQFMPWIGTVVKNTYDELYVVFPTIDNEWRIQCIPKEMGSFDKRKPLPASWAGGSVQELNKLIGIDDAVFCHTARFIAGAKSFDSIMKMSQIALED